MSWKTINRNPLGIRKLDVQAERRAARREHKAQAERRYEFWFGNRAYHEPMPMTRENLIRFAEVMLSDGWEQGVTVGAKATRGRVAEALERGTLTKPD